MAMIRGARERVREIIKLEIVDIGLRRVRPTVSHEALKCDEIASALPDEAVREAMPQMMWRKLADARAVTDALDQAPERLLARGVLRVLSPALTSLRVDPNLDLDGKDVIVGLGLDFVVAQPKLLEHVGIQGKPLPVLPLSPDPDAAPKEIDVTPSASENLGSAESGPLHQEDRGTFVAAGCGTNALELIDAGPVDVRLPFGRPADLSRHVDVDQVLGFRPSEERVKDGDDVGASGCLLVLPPPQALSEIGGGQNVNRSLRKVLSELIEDPTVGILRARSGVALEAAPVEERVDGALNPHSRHLPAS